LPNASRCFEDSQALFDRCKFRGEFLGAAIFTAGAQYLDLSLGSRGCFVEHRDLSAEGGNVGAIPVDGGLEFTRRVIDRDELALHGG
jgi:hypothetical protein